MVVNGQPVCPSCYVTNVIAQAAGETGAPIELADIRVVGVTETDEHTPKVVVIYAQASATGLHFRAQVPHEYMSGVTIVAATLAAYRETIAYSEGWDEDDDDDELAESAPREVFVH